MRSTIIRVKIIRKWLVTVDEREKYLTFILSDEKVVLFKFFILLNV